MKKRFLFFLMIALLVTLMMALGLSASAATSGDCGTDVAWSLDVSTGELSITGSGEMTVYSDTDVPWGAYAASIKKVTVADTVTSLTPYAFLGCEELTEVKLSAGLTVLGESAFEGCEALESITLPTTLVEIGARAFENCTSLKSLTVPASVTKIGAAILGGCASLESLTVPFLGDTPKPLTANKQYPLGYFFDITFYENAIYVRQEYVYTYNSLTGEQGTNVYDAYFPRSLRTVTVTGNVLPFGAFDGLSMLERIAYTANAATAQMAPNVFSQCLNLRELTLPFVGRSVEQPGHLGYLFENVSHTSHSNVLPRNLFFVELTGATEIADNAFYDCVSLLRIKLPATLTKIGANAFFGCERLVEIYNPSANVSAEKGSAAHGALAKNALSIQTDATAQSKLSVDGDGYVFYKDGSVCYLMGYAGHEIELFLPETYADGAYAIYAYAFYRSDIQKLEITAAPTAVGAYAFARCYELLEMYLPADLANVNELAFYHTDYVTKAALPVSVLPLLRGSSERLKHVDVQATEVIPAGTFMGFEALTTVRLPGGLKVIGEKAFYGCTKLDNPTLPPSVTTIGVGAFEGCEFLTQIHFGTDLREIGEAAFAGCTNLESVSFRKGVKSIGKDAFASCGNLFTVCVESVESWAQISFAGRTSNPLSYGANLCEGDHTLPVLQTKLSLNFKGKISAYAFVGAFSINEVTIGTNVTGIGYAAFERCQGITKISVPFTGAAPDSADTHLSYIFGSRTPSSDPFFPSLKEITLSAGNVIPANAFFGARYVSTFHLPEDITAIGEGAFAYSGLTSFTVPAKVTVIPANLFKNCENLVEVVLHNGVTEIGNSALAGCRDLPGIVLPSSLNKIGTDAFSGCNAIQQIEIPGSVERIGDSAFSDCTQLTSVVMHEGVKHIGISAFLGDTALRNVELPKGLKSIGDSAFRDNIQLAVLVFPAGLERIDSYAFFDCINLQTLTLPDGLREIGESAFCNARSLASLTLPAGLTHLGRAAFYGCSSLSALVINADLVTIGNGAFSSCGALSYIEINSRKLPTMQFDHSIFASAGTDSVGITVKIGKNLIAVPDYLFYDMDEGLITAVYFDAQSVCSEIGVSAFDGNMRLTALQLPASLRHIRDRAFADTDVVEVVLPEGLETLGQEAFGDSLQSLTVPASLRRIGYRAAWGITTLYIKDLAAWCSVEREGLISGNLFDTVYVNGAPITDLRIPDGVKQITAYAFAGWRCLKSVDLNGAAEIGASAFYRCDGLTALHVPATMRRIGASAFEYCYSLAELKIENGLQTIGSWAFGSCTQLTMLEIPGSVTLIDDCAFYECSGLRSLKISGACSVGPHAFLGCTALAHLDLGDKLTYIGSRAFESCTALTDVYLPASMDGISTTAFRYAALRNLYVNSYEVLENIENENFYENLLVNRTLCDLRLEKYENAEWILCRGNAYASASHAAHTHVWISFSNVEKCVADGVVGMICDVCGIVTGQYVPCHVMMIQSDANGHYSTCTDCGLRTQTEAHSYNRTLAKPATEDEAGEVTHACALCGHTLTEAVAYTALTDGRGYREPGLLWLWILLGVIALLIAAGVVLVVIRKKKGKNGGDGDGNKPDANAPQGNAPAAASAEQAPVAATAEQAPVAAPAEQAPVAAPAEQPVPVAAPTASVQTDGEQNN